MSIELNTLDDVGNSDASTKIFLPWQVQCWFTYPPWWHTALKSPGVALHMQDTVRSPSSHGESLWLQGDSSVCFERGMSSVETAMVFRMALRNVVSFCWSFFFLKKNGETVEMSKRRRPGLYWEIHLITVTGFIRWCHFCPPRGEHVHVYIYTYFLFICIYIYKGMPPQKILILLTYLEMIYNVYTSIVKIAQKCIWICFLRMFDIGQMCPHRFWYQTNLKASCPSNAV